MADEKKTMHSGWLETRDGELFAPKTIIDNVTARDGKSYDSVIKEYISSVQGGNENSIATIERDIDALYEKIKNFDGTDSDTFYIIDGSSNVIARIDASGIHSVEVEAQGYKLTEMGKKLDYINTDDLTEFFIMDGSGNIIMRVDNNGVTSVDFHSRNGSLNDVATRMTAVEMDIEAKFKNLDTSDSNEFVVRDSAGNIIARIDANGVTSVNFDTPTTISYTELVALVNSNNLTNNAAVENLKAYVDGRLKNFNGDDAEIFYIVDNNDPKNAIFKVDASGATSINFTTKEADLNTVANDLKTEIKAREDAINAEETARVEKDKLIDTAIGQLQQADADFTARLQHADFSDANTFYVIDKNNCIITRIDNEGTHSIDFIAYRDIEDGKESISLWALKDKVDENQTNIDETLSSEIERIEGIVEQNQAAFEGRKVNAGDELLGGGALKADITISHKTSGVDATYSLTTSEDISGSADSGDIHIPRITINEYGHVTNITDDSIKITMPDLAPLQQADAQFTEKLKFTDFSQSDALYIGDNDTEESNEDGSPKIKNLIAKIDNTGVTSVDFTAMDLTDKENPKQISLWDLKSTVDINTETLDSKIDDKFEELKGIIDNNEATFEKRNIIAGDQLTGGGLLAADITINHAEMNDDENYQLATTNNVSGSASKTTVSIPNITVNKYGHITNIQDKTFEIEMPDLAPLQNAHANIKVALTGDIYSTSTAQLGNDNLITVNTELTNTGVTSGNYGQVVDVDLNASKTTFQVPYYNVDEDGRLTASSSQTIDISEITEDIGALEQADADIHTKYDEKLKYVNLGSNNALYIGDNIKGATDANEHLIPENIIAKIDETGVTSVDFTAIDKRDEENPKSVSLLGLQTKVDNNHTSITTALDNTKKELNAAIETNEANITKNANAITKLNANSTTEGSVAYQIAQVVAGAPASYDTLKEIADWIGSDTTGAASMANDISNIKKWIDEDLDAKGYPTKQAEQDNLIANLQGSSVEASTQLEGSGNLTGENGASTKIEIKHSEVGPASGYIKNASTNNSTALISGSAQTGTIKIPQITVNKYGHITSAGTESVEIKMPDLAPLQDAHAAIKVQLTGDIEGGPVTIGSGGVTDGNLIKVTTELTDTGVTQGNYGQPDKVSLSRNNKTFKIPYYNVDEDGRLTSSKDSQIDIDAIVNDIGALETADAQFTSDLQFVDFTDSDTIYIGDNVTEAKFEGGSWKPENLIAKINKDGITSIDFIALNTNEDKPASVSLLGLQKKVDDNQEAINDSLDTAVLNLTGKIDNNYATFTGRKVNIGTDGQLTGGGALANDVTIGHAEMNNDANYKLTATADVSGSAKTTTVSIPSLTVNKYGHVTNIEDKTFKITMPDLAPLENDHAAIEVEITGQDATATSAKISNNKVIIDDLTLKTVNTTTGSYGATSGKTLNHTDSFNVPYFTVNGKGLVTKSGEVTYTLPGVAELENTLAGIKAQITGGDATSSEITISNNKLTISDLTLKPVNNTTGTFGMTTDQSPDFESSIKVPYFTVNGKGLITEAGHKTLTIPSLDPVNENIAGLSTQLAEIEERFSYIDGDDTFYIVDGQNNEIARFDASGLTTTNVILHKKGSDSIDFQNNAVFFESTKNTITINNI